MSDEGARTIGLLAMVDVGWEIWSRTDDPALMRLTSSGDPRGGVVVEVATRVDVDEETGEITELRAFRTLDPYRTRPELHWTILSEAQVNTDALASEEARPDRYRTWRLIVRLGQDVVKVNRTGQLDLTATEHDRLKALSDMGRLARSVTL